MVSPYEGEPDLTLAGKTLDLLHTRRPGFGQNAGVCESTCMCPVCVYVKSVSVFVLIVGRQCY